MNTIIYNKEQFRIIETENNIILQINIIFNIYKTICTKELPKKENNDDYEDDVLNIVKQFKNIIYYCIDCSKNIDFGF